MTIIYLIFRQSLLKPFLYILSRSYFLSRCSFLKFMFNRVYIKVSMRTSIDLSNLSFVQRSRSLISDGWYTSQSWSISFHVISSRKSLKVDLFVKFWVDLWVISYLKIIIYFALPIFLKFF